MMPGSTLGSCATSGQFWQQNVPVLGPRCIGSGGEDARLGAFGEDDSFRMIAKLLENAFDEFHGLRKKWQVERATRSLGNG